MSDRAQQLSSSVAGSVLLCELLGIDVVGRGADAVTERLLDARSHPPVPEHSPRTLLGTVHEVVAGLAFGLFDAWHDVVRRLRPEVRQSLVPAAQALVGSPAAVWWWDRVDAEQFWLRGADAPAPGSDGRIPTWSDTLSADDAGVWWVQPSSRPSTSRRIPGDTLPVAAVCPDWHERRGPRVGVWSVRTSAEAAVYEVRSPADWTALVAARPRRLRSGNRQWSEWSGWTGDWVVADWPSIAERWSGVHVTVGGWLTTAHRALQVPGGATMLAGWNPDETLWLRDLPLVGRHLTDVDLPDGA